LNEQRLLGGDLTSHSARFPTTTMLLAHLVAFKALVVVTSAAHVVSLRLGILPR